jgi:hypothetical protein
MLQSFAEPSAKYMIKEKLKNRVEEDGDAGSEGPAERIRRQLRQIEPGERQDLTVHVEKRD